jgi:methylthioribose-1-phosphate isomerase
MRTLDYQEGVLLILDQTRLPHETTFIKAHDVDTVADAIRRLAVRGAPAIGLAAAYGVALGASALQTQGVTGETFRRRLAEDFAKLRETRPTAVNLFWALERMMHVVESHPEASPADLADILLLAADSMLTEDEAINRRIGAFGAELIPDGANIITHCNTGFLATGSFGTALGVIRSAHEQGKRVHVWVDETRPLLQGARLTTWELQQLGISFTLITDDMAGHVMKEGRVDLALVGADRIASNGDTANKIGTYSLAVLCHFHALPFYVVAPVSTVDLALSSGNQITIEQRDPGEVTGFRGVPSAPEGVPAANPAFDVTPARLITGIVVEEGVVRPPFQAGLTRAARRAAGQVATG